MRTGASENAGSDSPSQQCCPPSLRSRGAHLAPHPTTPDIHPARSVADSSTASRPPHKRRGRIHVPLVETVRDAELTLLKKLGKAKGGPTGVRPQEAPRGPGLRRDDAS